MHILERLEALHEMIDEAEMLEEGMTNQASIYDPKYGKGHKVKASKRKKGYVLMQRGGKRIRVPAIGFWVHPSGNDAEAVFVAVKKKAGKLKKSELKAGGSYDRGQGGRTSGGGGKLRGKKDVDVPKADKQRISGAKKGWETRIRNMKKGDTTGNQPGRGGIEQKGFGRGRFGKMLGTAAKRGTSRFKARDKAAKRRARAEG